MSVMQWPLQSLCQQVILSRSVNVPFERPRSNMALQPTRYGVPSLAAGGGLRPFSAGHSWRHASARG